MRPTYPKLSLAPDDDFVLVSGDGADDAVPPETPTAGEGARVSCNRRRRFFSVI